MFLVKTDDFVIKSLGYFWENEHKEAIKKQFVLWEYCFYPQTPSLTFSSYFYYLLKTISLCFYSYKMYFKAINSITWFKWPCIHWCNKSYFCHFLQCASYWLLNSKLLLKLVLFNASFKRNVVLEIWELF